MTPITSVAGRRLAIGNLEKVLYPADGFTKGEVLHYYATIADVLLPHLRDRAVSFLRYPDGAAGQVFFTKNVPPGTPDWVTKAQVTRSDGAARMVVVQDLPSLIWAANLVAEFHTHQWTVTRPGLADRLVLDLDPGAPAGVAECCRVALWLRERLAADGIEAYAKTSGAKGLHLLAPVRDASPDQVSTYAKRLAVEAEATLPGLAVHRMTRALRPGKVFVDWSQNAARKTTATPYTLRARPEATASTPVSWEEVAECRDGLVFRAGDVVRRVEEYGDLLAPLFEAGRAGGVPEG
ncbi:ATP-dependent DNA ligase [Streptomyces sp. V2]|uniref:Non-homologous end-joining DNA ligase n=1 Tax=Streptomyces niveiscabiei TaxID=164115 RepID=A0ABW9HPS9_9ACTN|nr:non-homologous end-joining DNA ligase [Streptomyces sp. V2]PWG10897.1 ATP-dependent DNA ligase [Streptomyces sp. V2]